VYFEEYHLNGELEGKASFFKGIEVDTGEDYDDKMELIERREK